VWREKLFAGYLAALAALGFAIVQSGSAKARSASFAAGIVISIVFWIIDARSRQIVNACQIAAARFENDAGCYSALNRLRFDGSSRFTYWLGIHCLVAVSLAACAVGLIEYLPGVQFNRPTCLVIGAGVIVAFSTIGGLEYHGHRRRLLEKEWVLGHTPGTK